MRHKIRRCLTCCDEIQDGLFCGGKVCVKRMRHEQRAVQASDTQSTVKLNPVVHEEPA